MNKQLVRTLLEDIMYHTIGDNKIEIIKNPTARDIDQLTKEFYSGFPHGRGSCPSVRKTYDTEGNVYVWRSDKAVHHEIEAYLRKLTGTTDTSKFNQNQYKVCPQDESKQLVKTLLEANIEVKKIDSTYYDAVDKLIGNSFSTEGEPFLGLFFDGKLIGSVLLNTEENRYLPDDWRFDLVIRRKYRHKGYVHYLIKELIKRFKEDKQASQLSGEVANQDAAGLLVDKYGFDNWVCCDVDFVGLKK